jgi:hypothetical protein
MRTPLAAALFALAAGPAVAGTIEGRVQVVQPVPVTVAHPVVKDASVCGKESPNEAVIVDRAGGLRNAVVFLKDARFKGKPTPVADAALDQKQCRCVPHVQALTVGTQLSLIKGKKPPIPMRKPGPRKLQCDAGPAWMNAWIYVFDHPYYALSDEYGGFVINDIPPGTYTIEAWHEPADGKGPGVRASAKVTVTDDEPARVLLPLKL